MMKKCMWLLVIAVLVQLGMPIDARANTGTTLDEYLVQEQTEYKKYADQIKLDYAEFSSKEKKEYDQYASQVKTNFEQFAKTAKGNYDTAKNKLIGDFNKLQGAAKEDYALLSSAPDASKDGLQAYLSEANAYAATKMYAYQSEANAYAATKMYSYQSEAHAYAATKMYSYQSEANAYAATKMYSYQSEANAYATSKMYNYQSEANVYAVSKMSNYRNSVNKKYTTMDEAQTAIGTAKKSAQEAVMESRTLSMSELAAAKKLAKDSITENAEGAAARVKELHSSLVSVLEIRMNAYTHVNEIRKTYFMEELFKPIPELDLGVDYQPTQQPTSSDLVNLEGEPSLQVKRYPVEQILTPPVKVIPKTDAFVISGQTPLQKEQKITIKIDPDKLKGVDPKKISIWKFVSSDTLSAADKNKQVRIAGMQGYWESIGGKLDASSSSVSSYISEYGTYAAMLSNQTIADIQGHKYQYEIEVLLAQGIISGYSEEEFRPENGISRAEFAKVIVKGAHIPMTSEKASFQDVSGSHWANRYVASASKRKIIEGYSSERFGPGEPITREQSVTIVQRTGNLNTLSSDRVTTALQSMQDSNDVSDFAKKAVAETLEANMITTEENGLFSPQHEATRAVVAKMMMGLLIHLGYL